MRIRADPDADPETLLKTCSNNDPNLSLKMKTLFCETCGLTVYPNFFS